MADESEQKRHVSRPSAQDRLSDRLTTLGLSKQTAATTATVVATSINYTEELSAALTVSFVAMSLGAAFGVQSGRGPLKGVLSAGFIAIITATVGGTYVQCSGPTAPMTAVTTTLVSAVMDEGIMDGPCGLDEVCKNKFINLCLVLTGVLLILCGVCRLGKLITFVPKVVISGFMNGIAVLIWWGQMKKIYGVGRDPVGGGVSFNTFIMFNTTAIYYCLPLFLAETGKPWLKKLFPAALVAIVVITLICLPSDVERVAVGEPLASFSDVSNLFTQNVPNIWTGEFIAKALPFAFNLAALCYLDSLLTALVMDQKVALKYQALAWEKTNIVKELAAQGFGNMFVALFGGIPGAQATIRSVLILNEGARTRVAGICVGVFAIIEMAAFQSLVAKIPQAVFSGVLLKVGYDVFDYTPLAIYIKTKLLRQAHPGAGEPRVEHIDMFFILGTTIVTITVSLNLAVGAFTAAFYFAFLIERYGGVEYLHIPDLALAEDLLEADDLVHEAECQNAHALKDANAESFVLVSASESIAQQDDQVTVPLKDAIAESVVMGSAIECIAQQDDQVADQLVAVGKEEEQDAHDPKDVDKEEKDVILENNMDEPPSGNAWLIDQDVINQDVAGQDVAGQDVAEEEKEVAEVVALETNMQGRWVCC